MLLRYSFDENAVEGVSLCTDAVGTGRQSYKSVAGSKCDVGLDIGHLRKIRCKGNEFLSAKAHINVSRIVCRLVYGERLEYIYTVKGIYIDVRCLKHLGLEEMGNVIEHGT